MLCIKKQIGTIVAIASPTALCVVGVWDRSEIADAAFVNSGTWLATLSGFIAIVMVIGAQRRHQIPPIHVLLGAVTVTTVGLLTAIAIREGLFGTEESAFIFAAWRVSFVLAMAGMAVSIYAAAQVTWRYLNARFPEGVSGFSGLVRLDDRKEKSGSVGAADIY